MYYDSAGNVVYSSNPGGESSSNRSYTDVKNWTFDAAGRMTYWDEHGPWGNETRSENVGYDGDGRVVKKDDAENSTTWHYVVSSVTGQKITDIVYDGTWGLTHIYMGSTLIAETGSEDYLLFKTTDPVTGGTQDIDPDGTAPNNETSRNELAGLGTYVPHNQIYAPPPPSYMEGASATNPENGCELEGVPTPCSLAQLLREHPPYPIPKDPPKPVVVPAEHNVTSHSALRLASHGPSANADESTDILIDESIPKIGNFFVEVRDDFQGLRAEFGYGVGDAAKILNRTIERLRVRLEKQDKNGKTKCKDFFDKISDPLAYLMDRLVIASYHWQGKKLVSLKSTDPAAITTSELDEKRGRIASGTTALNLQSFFFTGRTTDGRFFDQAITSDSTMANLGIDEIRELVLLHELFHVNDIEGKFDDNDPKDKAKNAAHAKAIQQAVREACF